MPQLLSVNDCYRFHNGDPPCLDFHIWSVFLFSDRDISSIPQETALVIQRLIRYNDITFWEIFPQSGANCEAGSQKRLIIWEDPLL